MKPNANNPDSIGQVVRDVRGAFERGHTRSYAFRIAQLDGLLRMFEREEQVIVEALHADVGKPLLEAWAAEVSDCAAGIRYMRKHLRKWMREEHVTTSLAAMPGRSRIVPEPLGVVLVIAPWNYPFSLIVAPLAGALAAGNCAVVKPSEVTPRTSALIAHLLPKYLDTDCVRVIEGGVQETTELLRQRFDHVFYTGSAAVGRIVMAAAAKNLTPVTLELGGKSPCIVDASANLEVAAKRIVWAKFFNCGQTCVAPDYVLAHHSVHDRLLSLLKRTIQEFWGDDAQRSPDYGRIVNGRHHRRLMELIPGSGEVVIGGEADESDRFIAPTVLTRVPEDAPVMQEEIFGPLLPVLAIDDIHHAVRFVNARPKPLALYVFASEREAQKVIIERTSSGGVVVNHANLHTTVPGLPFGGVGESGIGAYHGKHSFDTFSHRKAVLSKPTTIDPAILYPPYSTSKKFWMKQLM